MELYIQYMIDALSLGSLYALLTLGIALVFGIMQLLNFAHGSLIMVGGYAMFALNSSPRPFYTGAAVVIIIVFALGMERLAFRPIRGATAATLLVASFAVAYLLENLAILIFSGRPRTVTVLPFLDQAFDVGGFRVARLSLATVVCTVVLLIALAAFLKKTRIGTQMRAAAEDFQMARLLGVRTNRVIATAFAMSGALAGVGALLLVAQTGGLAPDMGLAPVIVAFVATIIGGLGSLVGAVLGGYALGILTLTLDVALPLGARPYRDALLYAGVIALLALRPQGLLIARAGTSRVG